MIYITGDKHLDDILIVLGDAEINYYANDKDNEFKRRGLSKYIICYGIEL